MRPALYLDIDGVINVTSANPQRSQQAGWGAATSCHVTYQHTTTRTPEHYTLIWHPQLVDALNELDNHYDIRWLTTWGQQAATVFAPAVGLNTWPTTPTPTVSDTHQTWKVDYINTDQHSTPRPFAFIDDTVCTHLTPGEHDTHTTNPHPPGPCWFPKHHNHLQIRPAPDTGITAHHITALHNYAATN